MFTAVAHKNLAGAEGYFSEHLAQNDYYSAGELRPGRWIGIGAERLGLANNVTREQFHALCENWHPQSGERLTQRQQAEDKRRVFYDFTCSAPKSVSVMAVTFDDSRLAAAHEEATRVAFRELEAFAAARVRKQGHQRDRTTANLVASEFVHTSSRALDPRMLTTSPPTGTTMCAKECENEALTHAVAHLFERQSVVPEHELLAVALSHRQGELDLQRMKQAVRQSPELVPTDRGFSTRQILETELFLIQTVDTGRDEVAPLHPEYQPADWLSQDQRRAILHVLNTGDRITGLRGLAGTGKTTALRELDNACAAVGDEPLFCAPTPAATDILREEGFAAVTLQSLLLSKPSLSTRNLIVLDEAGAVGIDNMKRLFELATHCRLVLSGDTGQHSSVARGDARQYRPGMVLRFHGNKDGFAQGDSVEVVSISFKSLTVRHPDGPVRELKLGRGSASFDAGESRTLEVAAGDKLLLHANSRKRFTNGELVEVKAIQGDNILLGTLANSRG